jgi:hypothetical protein
MVDVERRKANAARRLARLTSEQHGTVTAYGYGCRCQPCTDANTASHREYVERNRDAINARNRVRRSIDPERFQAVEKAWRDANIEKVREQKRARYYGNHEANKAELRRRSRLRGERWAKAKMLLIAYLGGACVDCGNQDPRVLTFDHIDIEAKTAGMGDLVRQRGIDSPAVWIEVENCELRCANCHTIKTFVNGDYMKGKARQHGLHTLDLVDDLLDVS